MWNDKERQLAKSLQDEDMQAFLKKIFITITPSLHDVLDKNIVALDDAEYGRLMKIKYLSGEENKARINLINKLAQEKKEKPEVATAPR